MNRQSSTNTNYSPEQANDHPHNSSEDGSLCLRLSLRASKVHGSQEYYHQSLPPDPGPTAAPPPIYFPLCWEPGSRSPHQGLLRSLRRHSQLRVRGELGAEEAIRGEWGGHRWRPGPCWGSPPMLPSARASPQQSRGGSGPDTQAHMCTAFQAHSLALSKSTTKPQPSG